MMLCTGKIAAFASIPSSCRIGISFAARLTMEISGGAAWRWRPLHRLFRPIQLIATMGRQQGGEQRH